MTLRKEKLEDLRRQLMSRREALAQNLKGKTEELLQEESSYSDSIDQASAETDRTLASQMKNREEGMLTQIDEALRRIDGGAFGDCQSCGESIAEARLLASPLTTLCIDCKAELESEGNRHPGRM